ncbi:MAG: DNA gyrase subunit A [Bacteroidales bacterium]|jgi:DNA gyrase subunit A|nr:DNA gyrase subunit A [Bacteroidales bacterium]
MESENEKIQRVNIETQMKKAYIDYAMSVIVSRALPDARDGLKPVHRRILYTMGEMGLSFSAKTKKSARIVGDVMGKYHPHGDSSIYLAMVRMAQWWSMRYTLVEGQGNFGSIDQDPPAAMRYTEAKMAKIASEMLADIDKETVDFQNNYDDTLKEPSVLPTKIPQLLLNGANGIAVGMATNMAPHNLTEVINGTIAYIDNNDITIDELMQYIKAPDFPTGGIIYGYEGVKEAFHTGRGHVIIRANASIEQDKRGDHEQIIVTSVPYQVCKSEMIKRQAQLVEEKKIEGISNIKDESSKEGIRIVYKLKRDAISNVVLNKLYQYSDLQTSFSINNIALVKGRPRLLNLKDLIKCFVDHRHEVVERRTRYELRKAEERAHILEGLLKAIDYIDEIIAIIRSSQTVVEAKLALQERWGFDDIQADAIVNMRLRQLAGLERQKLQDEYDELIKFIERCKEILSDENVLREVIKNELIEVKDKYGNERLSKIEYSSSDFRIEDMIANEEVIISISHLGYIKRTPAREYHLQHRGGIGSKGGSVRDEDFIEHIYVASNHDYMLFFTEKGKCFWLRVFEIPEGSKTSKGRAIQNLLNIEQDDIIKAYVNTKDLKNTDYINNNYIILCTKKGVIKKTSLEAYSRPRQNGIIAITIKDGDELLEAKLTNGNNEILMAVRSGKCIRFNEKTVRPMGRNAAGVRAIRMKSIKDEVIGMICIENTEKNILVVSEKGYGKRSNIDEYRQTNRGAQGVKTINITDKTGKLIAIKDVTDNDDLMIMNKSGLTIRMAVSDLRIMGRATQGVRLINIKNGDEIAAIARINREECYEEESENQNGVGEFNDNNEINS